MKNSASLVAWIGSLVITLGLAAAAWIYSRSGERPQPAGPPEKLTLAVNNTYVGTSLVFIASANGYFRAEGLDVTLQPHTSGLAALDSMLREEADLATVAETPLMHAVMKGQPVSVVVTISTESRDHGIVARKDRAISTPGDLKGKRIGATIGTTSHFLIDVILVGNKISPQEVRIINLKPEQMADALLKGEVDAVSTWEPLLSQLTQALGDAGAALHGDVPNTVSFNVAGRSGFVKNNPEAMKKLLRALIRAEQLVDKQPAAARAIVAGAARIEPAVLDALWPGYNLRVKLEQWLVTLLEDQSRWAIKNGYVDKTAVPNFLDFIYLDALAAVKPDAVTIIR